MALCASLGECFVPLTERDRLKTIHCIPATVGCIVACLGVVFVAALAMVSLQMAFDEDESATVDEILLIRADASTAMSAASAPPPG